MAAARELGLGPTRPNHTSTLNARSHPIWSSPQIEVSRKFESIWRDTLELRSIKDTFKENGDEYTDDEIRQYIEGSLKFSYGKVKISKNKFVSVDALIKNWHAILQAIPRHLALAARGRSDPPGYSEASINMMRALGWKPGKGLGYSEQGITAPLTAAIGQAGREGLGYKKRKKTSGATKDKLRAVISGQKIAYGIVNGQYFTEMSLSIRGKPTPTGVTSLIDPSELREVLRWNGGVVGIAESTFPHPEEWRLGCIDKPLDKIRVRDLTKEFTRKLVKEPSCKKAWQKTLNVEPNWRGIGERYSVGLLTPKDFMSHFKLILHKHMFTNDHNPNASTTSCRLCGLSIEKVSHWGECRSLKPIFKEMRVLDKGTKWNCLSLNLLGMHPGMRMIPPGISMVHFILWKFILIKLTTVSLSNELFSASLVLESAKRRIEKRILTARQEADIIKRRALVRDREPDYGKLNKWLKGIGEVNSDGRVALSDEFVRWLWPPQQPE